MKIGLRFVLIALLSAVSLGPALAAGERYALVIGNEQYPDADPPLKGPIDDARAMAEELRRDGFSVDLGENLTREGMRRAFDSFYGKLRPGSAALLFFSGFGLQSNRQTYMVPIDASIWTEPDIRHEGTSLDAVLAEFNNRGAATKIAVLDAGRRNPFERRFRIHSTALAPTAAPSGSLVLYSTALATLMPEPGAADRGRFVRELLKEIRVPGVMAEEAFNRTRLTITRDTRSEQVPYVSSSLANEFSFVTGTSRPPVLAIASNPLPPTVATPVATVGRRVAMILGNASYKSMPALQNPRNDAVDVESAFKGLGFETVMATDLDLDGMGKAISRFSRQVRGADVAVVYYSGHGMQFNGKNYLLPIDASLDSAADVDRYHVVPVDDLIQVLGGASPGGLQLIVLDACRNNPVERDFKNKIASAPGANRDAMSTRGFARIDARNGLIVTYATAPNDVAADGTGRNSPFTQAFLKNVAIPDLDVRQMLFRVQSEVFQSSGSKQLPEISSLYVGPEVRLKTSQR